MLQQKANDLLELAEDADILYASEHRRIKTSRDFRVRYPTGGTEDLKQAIRKKYMNHLAPHRRGEMAYEETRDSFDSKGGLSTDFESTEWQREDD